MQKKKVRTKVSRPTSKNMFKTENLLVFFQYFCKSWGDLDIHILLEISFYGTQATSYVAKNNFRSNIYENVLFLDIVSTFCAP